MSAADERLLALIDRLTAILDRTDLTELEIEAGGTGIVVRKPDPIAQPAVQPPAARPAHAPGASEAAADQVAAPTPVPDPAPPPTPAAMVVAAPLTGIFYASPNPTASPFVMVGQEIVVGQVIGLIEAMKLYNEIKSDKAGRVTRLVAENGALVKAKQPLIEVVPL
jgi:acetyl-CoA carboxylase biotin carboxyl carrier protein